MNRRTGDKITIAGDYQYKAFFTGPAPQRFWHRCKIAEAIGHTSVAPGQSVLDAGCGSGMLTSMVAGANPLVRVTGLDGNPEAIRFCRIQWGHLENARFIEGYIDELTQWPDAGTDAIAFLEVLEHITDEQAIGVLSEFHRILKPGGVLVISTPNRKSLWPLQETIMDALHLTPRLKETQHERLYSANQLAELARSQGFLPRSRQTILFLAPWLAALSQKMAFVVHRWESKRDWLPGSLLLHTFSK